jgi:hypothetical protein
MYSTLLTTYNQLKNNPALFDPWVRQLSESDMDTVSEWLMEDVDLLISVVT